MILSPSTEGLHALAPLVRGMLRPNMRRYMGSLKPEVPIEHINWAPCAHLFGPLGCTLGPLAPCWRVLGTTCPPWAEFKPSSAVRGTSRGNVVRFPETIEKCNHEQKTNLKIKVEDKEANVISLLLVPVKSIIHSSLSRTNDMSQ